MVVTSARGDVRQLDVEYVSERHPVLMKQRVRVHAAVEHELGNLRVLEHGLEVRTVRDGGVGDHLEARAAHRLDVEEVRVGIGGDLQKRDGPDAAHVNAFAVHRDDVA